MPAVELPLPPGHKPPSRPPPPPPRLEIKSKLKSERLPSPRKNIENVPPKLTPSPSNRPLLASSSSGLSKSTSPYRSEAAKVVLKKVSPPKETNINPFVDSLSQPSKPCSNFSEHLWKVGECRECGKTRSEHVSGADKLSALDNDLTKQLAAIRNARLQARGTLPRPPAPSPPTIAPPPPNTRSPTKQVRAERLKYEALAKDLAPFAPPVPVNHKADEDRLKEELKLKEAKQLRESNLLKEQRIKEEQLKEQQFREATERLKLERSNKQEIWKQEMWQDALKSKGKSSPEGVPKSAGGHQRKSPDGAKKPEKDLVRARLSTEAPKREAPRARLSGEGLKADAASGRSQTPQNDPSSGQKLGQAKDPAKISVRAVTELPKKADKIEATKKTPQGDNNIGRLKSVWEQKTKEENNNEKPKVSDKPKENDQIVFRDGRLAGTFAEKQPELDEVRKLEILVQEAKDKLHRKQQQKQQEKLLAEQNLKEKRAEEERIQFEQQQEKIKQDKPRPVQIAKESQAQSERKHMDLVEADKKFRQEEEMLRSQEAARQKSQAEARSKEQARLKDKFNVMMAQAAGRRKEGQQEAQQPLHSGDSLDHKHGDLSEFKSTTTSVEGAEACAEFKAHTWLPGKCDNCLGPKELHKGRARPTLARQPSRNTLRGGTLKRDANVEPKKIATNIVGSLKYGTLARATIATPSAHENIQPPQNVPQVNSPFTPLKASESKTKVADTPLNTCGCFDEHPWRPNECKNCKKLRHSHTKKALQAVPRPAASKIHVGAARSVKELAATATVIKMHVPIPSSPAALLSPESGRGPATPIYPEVIPLDYLLGEEGSITPGSQIRKAKVAHKRRRRNTLKFASPCQRF